jgi:hypothetical protein
MFKEYVRQDEYIITAIISTAIVNARTAISIITAVSASIISTAGVRFFHNQRS